MKPPSVLLWRVVYSSFRSLRFEMTFSERSAFHRMNILAVFNILCPFDRSAPDRSI